MKDYRSEDGLYNTVKEYGVSPETILSHSFFLRRPDVFYDFYYKYFLDGAPEPNRAHTSLARLEEMGILSAVVTQNIDGLHTRGGSRTVYELHGTASEHTCTRCGAPFPLEELRALCGGIPYCKKCGGIVKPKVVLYEESLPEDTVNGAVRAIAASDLLIVGGTSLAVYPAASFLEYYRGKHIVLINKSETPYDRRAELVFRESIGEVLGKAVEILEKEKNI